MTQNNVWRPFAHGGSLGTAGSEGGTILLDEELDAGSRITLERTSSRLAITCGIYGWMVHTRFLSSESVARAEYATMKAELTTLVDCLPTDLTNNDAIDRAIIEINEFVTRYP